MSVISSQQLAAFHATEYRVDDPAGPFTLRIGERSLALQRLHDALGAASSAYLSAWNPLGETAAPEVNPERQIALQRDLVELGIPALPGEGRDPATGWAEQSKLAVGLSRDQAVELGNKYRQLAILFSGEDAIPKLVTLM
jgi:hypothetical protein